MESEWQTAKPKRKSKPAQPVSSVTVSTSNNIKKIPRSIISQYRPIYVDVTRELSNKFDAINEKFKALAHLQNSRVNHNQHNHNRWKMTTDTNDMTKILGCFNKLTKMNFDTIANEIKNYHIIDYNELTTVANSIYDKCIGGSQFVTVYVELIKKILMEYSWIVHDESSRAITFRKYFVDNLESNFDKILEKINSDAEYTDSEFECNNEERIAFVKIITSMYDQHILGTQFIRYFFTILENGFNDTGKEEYMDMWINVFKCVINHWTDNNSSYLDEKKEFIKNNNNKFNVRINMLIETTLNQKPEKVVIIEDVPEKRHDYDINMLIDSHGECGSLNDWCDMLDDVDDREAVIEDVIANLTRRTSNLKTTFGMLKLLMTKDNGKYAELVRENIRKALPEINNKSYMTNAGILLK